MPLTTPFMLEQGLNGYYFSAQVRGFLPLQE